MSFDGTGLPNRPSRRSKMAPIAAAVALLSAVTKDLHAYLEEA